MSDGDLPLVTTLVTFHNQARFVGPTLDTVLAQSYPQLETLRSCDAVVTVSPSWTRYPHGQGPTRGRSLR